MKCFFEQHGMASVLGLCFFSLSAFLGMALFYFTESEFQRAEQFVQAFLLRREAENGVLAGKAYLLEEKPAEKLPERGRPLFTLQNERSGGQCTI